LQKVKQTESFAQKMKFFQDYSSIQSKKMLRKLWWPNMLYLMMMKNEEFTKKCLQPASRKSISFLFSNYRKSQKQIITDTVQPVLYQLVLYHFPGLYQLPKSTFFT